MEKQMVSNKIKCAGNDKILVEFSIRSRIQNEKENSNEKLKSEMIIVR